MNMNSLKVASLALAVAGLTGCSAMNAQNPGEGYSPVNAVTAESADSLMLFGADVVAYQTESRMVKGTAEHSTVYQDVTFHFNSAENKALFESSPEKYLPQYGGYCANGIMFGIPWGGNAEDFLVHNGKLYIFGGGLSKAAFELNLNESIQLADQYWAEEVQGSNSFLQRAKRLVFRVPHYQSGEEQAQMVQKAKGG